MLMGSKLHGVPVSATEAVPPTSPKVLSVSSTSATLSGIRAPLTIDDSDFEYDSFSSNESDSGIASDGFLSSEDGSETAAPDGSQAEAVQSPGYLVNGHSVGVTSGGSSTSALLATVGHDLNTNACLLAENFRSKNQKTQVIECSKTIGGDLRCKEVPTSFSFHTASKLPALILLQTNQICCGELTIKGVHFWNVKSEDEKCILLADLKNKSTEWYIKIIVAEKTPIRRTRKGGSIQRYVFVDKEAGFKQRCHRRHHCRLHHEKPRRILESPTDSQIRTISQVKNLTQQSSVELKSFWLKARAKIAKLDQRLYAFSCPGCSKTCGLSEPSEFTCLYCNTNYPNPNSVLRFELQLTDNIGCLHATIEENEAETLLKMSKADIIQVQQTENRISIPDLNQKFEDVQQFFYLRTNKRVRDSLYPRYNIIASLPILHLSSAKSDSEKESVASDTASKMSIDTPSLEDEATTSKQVEARTIPAKRMLQSTDSPSYAKHIKQD
ncbi:OLC1v1008428C1 [Oldenlandia corymbosa var. corymbosa]|uniref:OLC1v1008428C1 n=1 Tax=Oldenlandia corymbosa var. corymbosa TaxID=529605 RepID=A0AAV1DPX9_OLDCO|nr:OLC1v1008428C1 [Oldenlandia corymbosa var. corymbosa]